MKKILFCISAIIFIAACKKNEITIQQGQAFIPASSANKGGGYSPTVTTTAATAVGSISANVGGNVSSTGGGGSTTSRGICFNISPSPTISNQTVTNGAGAGSFICNLAGLTPGVTYYARAFAIKSSATYYGNEVSFTTPVTVTDADGNVYNAVIIGTQTWTMENLKTTKYSDGTLIPNVTDDMAWYNLSTGAWCSYNNDDANVATYGRLYNWFAVNDAHNLAPAGWHVPSYDEWQALISYLGGCQSSTVGKKLKDNILWNGDNSSGFKALPGGHRYSGFINPPTTYFSGISLLGDWWTSTPMALPEYAQQTHLDYADGICSNGGFGNLIFSKKTGYSVRLLKN